MFYYLIIKNIKYKKIYTYNYLKPFCFGCLNLLQGKNFKISQKIN